jgi:hypothetical protein
LLDAYGRITGTFSGTVFGTGACNLDSVYFSGTTINFLKPEGGWYDTVISGGGISTNNLQATGGSLSGMTSISTDSISASGGSLTNMGLVKTNVEGNNYWYVSMDASDHSAYLAGSGGSISFGSTITLYGTWTSASSLGTASDEKIKNSIFPISTDKRYDILFDELIPARYKYNDGTSGRTHTGYIAQDVLAAVENAGLSTTDFAGYIKANVIDQETGKETETCYLRYEEFVALNTDQIQKLKRRVVNAEAEIALLKEEILCLRE